MHKIVAIVPYTVFPPKMGGQKGIALFYKFLGELLPVAIITTSNTILPEKFPAKFYNNLGSSLFRYFNPFLIPRALKILRLENATHLILEHPYFGWLGIILKKIAKVKLVIHSHNIESLRFKSTGKKWWRLLEWYEKSVHRNADINFFITEEDKNYAVKTFNLKKEKCFVITYGFDLSQMPTIDKLTDAKNKLRKLYSIKEDEKIYLFNGTLNYKPNLDALEILMQKIEPGLILKGIKHKIIICGKGLPKQFEEKLKSFSNFINAGFVDDINLYFLGSDVFLNPIIDGGGIKTKLVEAIGNGLSAVSTVNGAIGVPRSICGEKLIVVENNDYTGFADAIIKIKDGEKTPQGFYNHFYWHNIAAKAEETFSI